MRPPPVRLVAVTAAASAALLVIGVAPALAHIGTSTDSIVAGQASKVAFTVGHGCDGSPTTALALQLPESVIAAKPYAHPGWDIEIEREPLAAPVEQQHGDPVTERPAVIRFTARDGEELENEVRDEFAVNVTAPDSPGETLSFKIVQTCSVGETAWIEEWDGEGDEPEHPAPSVAVVAADAQVGDVIEGAAEAAGVDADGGSDSSTGLAVAGLAVGALGLAAGGAALARSRGSAAR